MKKVLLKLSLSSLFILTMSCGQLNITYLTQKEIYTAKLTKFQKAKSEVDEIVLHNKTLNRKLGQSYTKVVSSVARTANPFELAKWALSSDTELVDLFTWADTLLDNIDKINTPLINKKVAEIENLKEAETDEELKKRYDAILSRMKREQKTTEVNVRGLRKLTQRGIRNVERAEKFMVGGNASVAFFFLFFGSEIYSKIVNIEIALTYLDENLLRIEEGRKRVGETTTETPPATPPVTPSAGS